jgi:hypothetical protein
MFEPKPNLARKIFSFGLQPCKLPPKSKICPACLEIKPIESYCPTTQFSRSSTCEPCRKSKRTTTHRFCKNCNNLKEKVINFTGKSLICHDCKQSP